MSPSEPKLVMTMRFPIRALAWRRPTLEGRPSGSVRVGPSGAHSPGAHVGRHAALEAQAQLVARPRPELRIRLHRLLREQPWLPALRDGGQHKSAFDRREALPDAYPRAATEREVGVARTAVP